MYTVKTEKNFNSLLRDFDELFEIFNQKPFERNEKDFFVEIPLPGLSKENVGIEVKDRTLIVKINLDEPTGFIKRYKNEFYSYYLSESHDLNKITAKMEHGLLSLSVPLKREKKKESIKIDIE
jgi:HSP20 family molecular chaperone IbpA